MAPVFEIPLDDPIYLFRTENMMIHCQPAAGPIPLFTWYKDNTAITVGGRFELFLNGTLLIKGVLSTDSGVYKCLAENSLGKGESSGTAIVLGINLLFIYIKKQVCKDIRILNCNFATCLCRNFFKNLLLITFYF